MIKLKLRLFTAMYIEETTESYTSQINRCFKCSGEDLDQDLISDLYSRTKNEMEFDHNYLVNNQTARVFMTLVNLLDNLAEKYSVENKSLTSENVRLKEKIDDLSLKFTSALEDYGELDFKYEALMNRSLRLETNHQRMLKLFSNRTNQAVSLFQDSKSEISHDGSSWSGDEEKMEFDDCPRTPPQTIPTNPNIISPIQTNHSDNKRKASPTSVKESYIESRKKMRLRSREI